jgi:hypothetical protein
MWERYQLFFGLRFVIKEFQHPAIQTKIEQRFGGFFHQIGRQEYMQTRDPDKQEVGFIFIRSSSEL